ncbi:cyclin-dependent protein kinase complex component [Niveomyces insectorum RCEF 264]|uniref:Cyclin-dependent protein kinase complex component n=1 Tax=Niveomyces insectorum RCEF 264 TaxID=1081102 RepID=A0A167P2G2_9HYPO|nr:cyclin-dependent protein kinase complex component [Niveomyces insectorum RCEF 264]
MLAVETNVPTHEGPGSTLQRPPPRPNPSSDPRLASSEPTPPDEPDHDAPSPHLAPLPSDDLFDVTPLAALHLLGAGIEALVRITGDIPPTPPPPGTHAPTNMRGMQAEKDVIVRTLSANSLARLRQQAEAEAEEARRQQKQQEQPPPIGQHHGDGHGVADNDRTTPPRDDDDAGTPAPSSSTPVHARLPPTPPPAKPLHMGIDGVHLRVASPCRNTDRAPGATPRSAATTTETTTAKTTFTFTTTTTPSLSSSSSSPSSSSRSPYYTIIGANAQPLNVQHAAIARKFYSKQAPPIGIPAYLQRLHRFCPMSTGVYLATSLYIYRLAVAERAIAVTPRNAHRLLLAGLRVAMKALEDLSYPHAKLARVGGVSATELARLEISFCFLAGFELAVGTEAMRQHWVLMQSGHAVGALDPYGGADAVIAGSATGTTDPGTAAVLAAMETRRHDDVVVRRAETVEGG